MCGGRSCPMKALERMSTSSPQTLEYARPEVRRAPRFVARLGLTLLAVYVPHLWLMYTQRNDWEWQQLWLKILPMLPGLCAGFFLPLPAGMIVLTIAIVMGTPILTARLSRTAFIAMIS